MKRFFVNWNSWKPWNLTALGNCKVISLWKIPLQQIRDAQMLVVCSLLTMADEYYWLTNSCTSYIKYHINCSLSTIPTDSAQFCPSSVHVSQILFEKSVLQCEGQLQRLLCTLIHNFLVAGGRWWNDRGSAHRPCQVENHRSFQSSRSWRTRSSEHICKHV